MMETLAKPCTGFVLNILCPKVWFFPKPLPPLSKNELNLTKRCHFILVIQDINVTVGLKMLTIGNKHDNIVMFQGKKLNLV